MGTYFREIRKTPIKYDERKRTEMDKEFKTRKKKKKRKDERRITKNKCHQEPGSRKHEQRRHKEKMAAKADKVYSSHRQKTYKGQSVDDLQRDIISFEKNLNDLMAKAKMSRRIFKVISYKSSFISDQYRLIFCEEGPQRRKSKEGEGVHVSFVPLQRG